MKRDDVLAAYDRAWRQNARARDPLDRVERTGLVVRFVGFSPIPFTNAVLWSGLDEVTAEKAIAGEIRRFDELGRDFEWRVYGHDRPADLANRLRAAGFEPEARRTLMALEVGRARPGPAPPAHVEIRINGAAAPLEIVEVQRSVWGDDVDWLAASLQRERAVGPDGVSLYVALANGQPVSTGWIRFEGRLAMLHGGATRREHRGSGLYRALLDARLGEARRRGVEVVLADATSDSRPVLARSGFEALVTMTPFVHRARSPRRID